MSTRTVNLKISIPTSRFRRQLSDAEWAFGRLGILFTSKGERDRCARELALGRRLQARNLGWDAQCVTTNEGRCRVVVRRLGGWA